MNDLRFYVIGGQYETVCYGATKTLHAAKVLATKNAEFWDNWQGWHTPEIYSAEDVVTIESKGRITTRDGVEITIPVDGAMPMYVKVNGKWEGR